MIKMINVLRVCITLLLSVSIFSAADAQSETPTKGDTQNKITIESQTTPQAAEFKKGMDEEEELSAELGVDMWGKCVITASDWSTCGALASKCGYASCSVQGPVQGLFGGCAGLSCSCSLPDGSTFTDIIGTNEMNAGEIKCDKFIPYPNRPGDSGSGIADRVGPEG